MLTPSKKAFVGGVAAGLAGAGAVHVVGNARKKARNRALLARIRPIQHGMEPTASFASLPERIIAFSGNAKLALANKRFLAATEAKWYRQSVQNHLREPHMYKKPVKPASVAAQEKRDYGLSALPQRIIAFAKKIDLGREYGGCSPCLSSPSGKMEKYYPTIWIDGKASPIDLPQSGKATVNYKVVSRTSREVDGKTTHDASIEIQSIEPEEKDDKKKPGAAKPVKFSSLPQRIISFAHTKPGNVWGGMDRLLGSDKFIRVGAREVLPMRLGKIGKNWKSPDSLGVSGARVRSDNLEALKKVRSMGGMGGKKYPSIENRQPMKGAPLWWSSLTRRIIAFSRDRNADGEFAPQSAGGAGPAEMEKVYGTASLRRSSNVGGKVAAVAGGLGLGAAAILSRGKLRSLRKV